MIIASYNIHIGLNGLTGVSKNLEKQGMKSKEENLLHGPFISKIHRIMSKNRQNCLQK